MHLQIFAIGASLREAPPASGHDERYRPSVADTWREHRERQEPGMWLSETPPRKRWRSTTEEGTVSTDRTAALKYVCTHSLVRVRYLG